MASLLRLDNDNAMHLHELIYFFIPRWDLLSNTILTVESHLHCYIILVLWMTKLPSLSNRLVYRHRFKRHLDKFRSNVNIVTTFDDYFNSYPDSHRSKSLQTTQTTHSKTLEIVITHNEKWETNTIINAWKYKKLHVNIQTMVTK